MTLEDHNFKIERTDDWKIITSNDVKVYENPTHDVFEYADGESAGEQLFTWEAAMRETKKAGKHIPTDDEFSEFVKMKSDVKNLKFPGYRSMGGSYGNRTHYGYLWSSTQTDSSAWNRYFNYSVATVNRNNNPQAYGFSVRCAKGDTSDSLTIPTMKKPRTWSPEATSSDGIKVDKEGISLRENYNLQGLTIEIARELHSKLTSALKKHDSLFKK